MFLYFIILTCFISWYFVYLFFKLRKKHPVDPNFNPKVLLITPFKGLEQNTRANALSILNQDYNNIQIYFVVDSKKDEAYQILKDLEKDYGNKLSVIISGISKSCSQKVYNIVRAIQKCKEYDILVVLDSDGSPSSDFISKLISPLRSERISITTGYPKYFPPNKTFFGFGRAILVSLGIVHALNPFNRGIWGGAFAIKREDFEKIGGVKIWERSVCEDRDLTCAISKANLNVSFVPEAFLHSPEDATLSSFLEYWRRRYLILKLWDKPLWISSGVIYFAFLVPYIVLLLDLVDPLYEANLVWTIASILIIIIGSILILKFDFKEENQLVLRAFFLPIYFFVMLLAFCQGIFQNELQWRGVTYKFNKAGKLIVLR
ncbi:ceramide glucosyltransferase [Thermodesulfobium acidiphilum]|uniref:Ceramide glucosyltransferase n=1 Tax=Thermodesulfobium acidiphilum TaxID=1794699 RepID=A0A2R4VZS6_THEAF|nr:ceramide glucosyltransferase [Thermodesulfobium acidiphilum]